MSDKVIMYRESLLHSIISDVVTFGLTIVCMLLAFHFGTVVWEITTVGMFAVLITGKVMVNVDAVITVYSKEELLEYAKTLNKQDEEVQ